MDFSFSTFFDLNSYSHTLKPEKSNTTHHCRQFAIFLASNGQNFVDVWQFFGFLSIFWKSAKLKTRGHFNIIAYDWILGDEWQFFGTRFCWGVRYLDEKTCTFEGLRQHQLATFGRVKTNVPGFVRNSI